ncbi:hypothetical protein L204_104219 [Cryptococcus depauperatus]
MGQRFKNPWASFKRPSVNDIFQSISINGCHSEEPFVSPLERIPETTTANFKFPKSSPRPRVMWLGHAGVYLQIPRARDDYLTEPIGVLFDPVFSSRCSPVSFVGPKRRLSPPCRVSQLPAVHLVVISHDHYDHLDKQTIKDIEATHGSTVQYVVPTGVKSLLVKFGIPQHKIHQLGWWEETQVYTSDKNTTWTIRESTSSETNSLDALSIDKEKELLIECVQVDNVSTSSETLIDKRDKIRIICTPAQHNSGRLSYGKNRTLWATWYLECSLPGDCFDKYSEPRLWRCFFGGDTGYQSQTLGPICPIFKEISDRYGPPDLAFLPIANGSILPYLSSLLPFISFDVKRLVSSLHCLPSHAIDVHRDLRATVTMPIHWGTWMGKKESKCIARDLRVVCKRMGVELRWGSLHHQGIGVGDVGVWMEFGQDRSD